MSKYSFREHTAISHFLESILFVCSFLLFFVCFFVFVFIFTFCLVFLFLSSIFDRESPPTTTLISDCVSPPSTPISSPSHNPPTTKILSSRIVFLTFFPLLCVHFFHPEKSLVLPTSQLLPYVFPCARFPSIPPHPSSSYILKNRSGESLFVSPLLRRRIYMSRLGFLPLLRSVRRFPTSRGKLWFGGSLWAESFCGFSHDLRSNFTAPNTMNNKRAVEGTEQSILVQQKIGGDFEAKASPEFIQRRLGVWNSLYSKQQAEQAQLPRVPISVQLPDGKTVEAVSNQTTPLDIALSISKKGIGREAIISKVSYLEDSTNELLVQEDVTIQENEDEDTALVDESEFILWDLNRPLQGDCKLQFLKFDDPEGKIVFWHSSAHILGEALERVFGAHLTVGPPLNSGFYYDSYVGDMRFSKDTYKVLQDEVNLIIAEDQKFERLICSKEDLLRIFEENPFKVQLITNKVPDGSMSSCYRCGPLIDLCRGPHIPSTKLVKSFAINKHSSAYWLGNKDLDSLQRIYGIAFPETKQMNEYNRFMEEAKKRDHRVLGTNLQYFFFDNIMSPGSCFWLPDGAKLYNKLCEFIRVEYRLRGFQEVVSPNIYSVNLWKTSGHYANYKDNMYMMKAEDKEWGLKPMNCPGHCIIFTKMNPSYRQLPIRMADFGVLHRNEVSGSLSGLTRVRRFQQDDAHIFCRMDQVQEEVQMSLDFLFFVYKQFGFKFELLLSTRPKKAMGSQELWDEAENSLKSALKNSSIPWKLNPGDGAFYGPKIDVLLWDAVNRKHQCGTIQLDFQLPLRFNLQYRTQDEVLAPEQEVEDSDPSPSNDPNSPKPLRRGMARPVMIHRAILGSVERMCAILLEHTAGKLPFWLSPRQALVLPIADRHNHYGEWVVKTLTEFGFDVSIDTSNNTLNKKIREGQLSQWNYLLIVGDKEVSSQVVTVRDRRNPKEQFDVSIEDLIKLFEKENKASSRPMREVTPYVAV